MDVINMSRPRVASVEAKVEIARLSTKLHEAEKKIEELEDFKVRIELGQKWLMCVIYAIGGFAVFVYTVIEIFKNIPVRFGN